MRECENCHKPIVKAVMPSGAEVWVHMDRNGVPADQWCARTVAKPKPLAPHAAVLSLFLEGGEMGSE